MKEDRPKKRRGGSDSESDAEGRDDDFAATKTGKVFGKPQHKFSGLKKTKGPKKQKRRFGGKK